MHPAIIITLLASVGTILGARKIDQSDKVSKEAFSTVEGARLRICQAARLQEKSLTETCRSFYCLGQLKANLLEGRLRDFYIIFSQIKSVDFGVRGGGAENLTQSQEGALAALRKEGRLALAALTEAGGRDSKEAVTDFGVCGIPMLLSVAGAGLGVSPSAGLTAKRYYFQDMLDKIPPKNPDKRAASEVSLTVKELLAGFYNESGAENKLELAKGIKGKSIVCKAEVDDFCQKLAEIQDVTDSAIRVLGILNEKLTVAAAKLEIVIDLAGNDYSLYNDRSKKQTLLTLKIVLLIKTLLETSILTESGDLMDSSEKVFKNMESQITGLEA
jgi:hypothetical protein